MTSLYSWPVSRSKFDIINFMVLFIIISIIIICYYYYYFFLFDCFWGIFIFWKNCEYMSLFLSACVSARVNLSKRKTFCMPERMFFTLYEKQISIWLHLFWIHEESWNRRFFESMSFIHRIVNYILYNTVGLYSFISTVSLCGYLICLHIILSCTKVDIPLVMIIKI